MHTKLSGIQIWEMYYVRVEREPSNCKDKCAVAILNESSVVGHIPYNIAPTVLNFLLVMEVMGGRVRQGSAYGMEIPCKYRFYGPKEYIDKLKELITMDNIEITVYCL